MNKPRRLRGNDSLRRLVRETRISLESLVYPLFVREGNGICEEINAMPGQFRYSIDRLRPKLEHLQEHGVSRIMLFGIPDQKDGLGCGAYAEHGIVQQAVRQIKRWYPSLYVITDVCLCEYTSHGHCGVIDGETVDNAATLPLLAETALSHVRAGADMVAPSDMMDGRVKEIRRVLDSNGYEGIPLMSYAVKYASAFYGPFREAAGSAPAFGDRKTYQMDYHNRREALKEAMLDAEEGADILMVKPALACLDIIREVADAVSLPVAAYSVSGEYAMVKAASAAGMVDGDAVLCEIAAGTFRAGAGIYLTYAAERVAEMIREGRIG